MLEFIFNNSPIVELIQNCKLHKCIELLSKNHNLYTPIRVLEEFTEGDPDPIDVECIRKHFQVLESVEDPFVLSFFDYDPTQGEYWVVANGYHNPDRILVIDDGLGRFVAEHLDLPLTGTIGILGRIRDEGLISRESLEIAKRVILEGNFYLDGHLRRELKSL